MKKMKKLKLKKPIHKENNTHDLNGISQLIFENPKNINKFNIILEDFILSMQQNEIKQIKTNKKYIDEILDYFLIKNKKIISNDLIVFLVEKLETMFKIYLDILEDNISNDEGGDSKINELIINFLLNDLKKYYSIENQLSVKNIFISLINLFILKNEIVDPELIKLLVDKITKDEKNLIILLENLSETLHNKNHENSQEINTHTLYNLYNFIIILPQFSEEGLSGIKKLYQNIIIFLINHSLFPKSILKNLLLNLNKNILENVDNPLIFADYLINIYEKADMHDFDIKVLSLSGLFVLITKYKLDYEHYYKILYQTISLRLATQNGVGSGGGVKTIFDSKYRSRVFKILELSFKSPTVPLVVILSVIKRLIRVCLISSDNIIAIILGLIQNVIKAHPKSLILLTQKKNKIKNTLQLKDEKIKEVSKFDWDKFDKNLSDKNDTHDNIKIVKDGEVDDEELNFINENNLNLHNTNTILAKYEQFNDEEIDPYKTNAKNSSLWELYTLQNHYSFKIRNLVNNFTKNFLKKEFDLNSISGLKLSDMFYEIDKTNAHFYVTPNSDQTLPIYDKIKQI
jgi:hypothetical protein